MDAGDGGLPPRPPNVGVIGLYGRREDNTFYRRSPEGLQVAGGT